MDFGVDLRKSRDTGPCGFSLLLLLMEVLGEDLMEVLGVDCKSNNTG